MVTAPDSLTKLVDRFSRHVDAYRSGNLNETEVRVQFIDPLFIALGWDVRNEAGYAEAYKDVIHEDAIKEGAPDYCFRIGGARKFFLEAKRPSVDIRGQVAPAYQLRRYAWSAKLPLSILTDFEEFAVYDCRIRPKPSDKPAVARTIYLKYGDYADKWDELAAIFSKQAVLEGSFDKYVAAKRKAGTAEVDAEFLREIEKWRDALARNIAIRNPKVGPRELNSAVQRTIDRIIFLRICEDRGAEPTGQLQALISGDSVYKRLFQIFQAADDRYNSGLFHFQKERDRPTEVDELTPALKIDDKVLKDIFRSLYYPHSPYEFSVLPADILGNVYEQFLGKVISLTPAHYARIEEKPEVKKAGGVYYTPKYIVDYIVEHTVGKLLEGKTPQEIGGLTATFRPSRTARPLRVLDPACGSGSFLIGAYRKLLAYHRDWYVAAGPEKHRTRIYQGAGGLWYLTNDEKKRILLANIYGVDIDPQAVEVTKLNLLLAALENENQGTMRQIALIHRRALPDLGNNIKCGNSLIGTDFYEKKQLSLFDDETKYKINAFDWETEFPEIFKGKNPGFDAVIGNPPYVFTREIMSVSEREYYAKNFTASWEKQNTYMLFMEKMMRLLNRGGKGSYIVPNSWLTIESAKLLRQLFVDKVEVLVDLNYRVFQRVSMEPSIFVTAMAQTSRRIEVFRVCSDVGFASPEKLLVDRNRWKRGDGRFTFSPHPGVDHVVDAIAERCLTLSHAFDVRTGLQAYEAGKGMPPQTRQDVKNHVFDLDGPRDEHTYRYLQGRDVRRYRINWSGQWLHYGPWLSQPRQLTIFTRPRLLLREITGTFPRCLNAAFVDEAYLNNKSILNVLHPRDDVDQLKLLTAIVNSRLYSLYYRARAVKGARRIFPKVVIKNLRQFPFPTSVGNEVVQRSSALVDQMLSLHKQLSAARTEHDKRVLQRQIDATDREIDRLVYELYGLTGDEIAIVEEAIPQ